METRPQWPPSLRAAPFDTPSIVMKPDITFSLAATGDSFITRRLPEGDPESRRIEALISRSAFRFTNLETTVRLDNEGYPAAQSGGTWATTSPEALRDLQAYGFNAVSWATNHTLDYSHGGLEATLHHLAASGLAHAGAGRTLAEAASPRYIESQNGRVALIAATSTFHESWIAGNPRPEIGGRPGVNPLRFTTHHRVSAARLSELRAIARQCALNAAHDLSVYE